MVSAFEADHPAAAGVVTGDAYRVLHRLASGIGQQGFFRVVAGRDAVEGFAEFHHGLEGGDQRAGVDVFLGLGLDGRYHLGRAVTNVHHADGAREIEQGVSVDIRDHSALGIRHHNIGGFGQTRRHGIGAALKDGLTDRSGNGGFELDGHGRKGQQAGLKFGFFLTNRTT